VRFHESHRRDAANSTIRRLFLQAERGHAAETPSSRYATPPLRFGAFGVTASRRRGFLPTCPFGARSRPLGRIGHQKDMQANGHRRAELSRFAKLLRSDRRRRLDLYSEHGDGSVALLREAFTPAPRLSRRRSARLFRLETDAQARARGLGEALQRSRRRHGFAAFQPRNHGLRRSHRLSDLFLRHGGLAARLDERRSHGDIGNESPRR